MPKQLTLGSLFDGIGAFPYAASLCGIRPVWASEILPAAISVTQRHFPAMLHLGDITALDGAFLPPVDIVAFGSPCQDLSCASGKRLGLAGARSGLFTQAIRIINEMRNVANGQPRWAIWENVPGCFSSGNPKGSDFQAVLTAFAERKIPMPASGRWASAGMVRSRSADLAWCVYNAADFGLAQRRKRCFLVADFGGNSAAEILFKPKSLSGYFAAGGIAGQGAAAAAPGGADGASRLAAGFVSGADFADCGINGDRAGTLDANYHKGPGMRCGVERDVVLCAATGQSNAEILTDRAPTLNCNCEQPLVYAVAVDCRNLKEVGGQSGTLQAKATGGYSLNYQNPVRTGFIVRRLTPTEAERLMGFPDGYTLCSADGMEISDTKRYAMLGNSIATPCAAHIMQGVLEEHERST